MRWHPLILAILTAVIGLAGCSHSAPPPNQRAPSSEPALLSAAEISSLPPLVLRSGEDKTDAKTLWRLWKDAGNADGPEFIDYLTLFPNEFRLLSRPQTQSLVDRLVQRIFESETGKKSFCFLASEGTKDLRTYLMVSAGAAKKMQQGCAEQNKKITDAQKQMLRLMHQKILTIVDPLQLPKKFIFLVHEGVPSEIEAFTTNRNTSLFILPRDDLSETRLVRMLSHELAMSYDQFSWIANEHDTQTWQSGMGVIYSLPMFSGDGNGSARYFRDGHEREIRCALYDLPLRYALSTERAFRFEDRIVHELGIDTNSYGGETLSCEENVRRWLPFFRSFLPIVDYEMGSRASLLVSECGEKIDGEGVTEKNLRAEVIREGGKAVNEYPASQRALLLAKRKAALLKDWQGDAELYKKIQARLLDLQDPERQKILAERISTLKDTTLEPKDGSAPVNLCRLLQEPQVGPRYPNLFYGGPRPRAGGWDSK